MKPMTFPAYLSMFLRSLFVQGSFSAKYRQNIGFAFCMKPVADRLCKTDDDRLEFYRRHTEYYNGNPFMSTLVIGAVARMEYMLAVGEDITENDIRTFKSAIGAATGSVGDRLFWTTMRPFAILLGILGACLTGLWGALVMVVAFNVPALALRFRWVIVGYHLGPRVIDELKNRGIEHSVRVLTAASAILMGVVTAILVSGPHYETSLLSLPTLNYFGAEISVLAIPSIAAFGIVAAALHRGWKLTTVFVITVLTMVSVGIIAAALLY